MSQRIEVDKFQSQGRQICQLNRNFVESGSSTLLFRSGSAAIPGRGEAPANGVQEAGSSNLLTQTTKKAENDAFSAFCYPLCITFTHCDFRVDPTTEVSTSVDF